MVDYIKREATINEFAAREDFYDAEWGNKRFTTSDVEEILKSIPAADVVEVVRCKDCKYCGHDAIFGQDWCNGQRVTPDYFCADGERRSMDGGADDA